MRKKTSLFNKKDLIAYFLIAGAGAIVQLVCGGLLKDWFKLNYEATILPAYFISVIVGFTAGAALLIGSKQLKVLLF